MVGQRQRITMRSFHSDLGHWVLASLFLQANPATGTISSRLDTTRLRRRAVLSDVGYWHLADVDGVADRCPLSGVKETLQIHGVVSANDPKRTSNSGAVCGALVHVTSKIRSKLFSLV